MADLLEGTMPLNLVAIAIARRLIVCSRPGARCQHQLRGTGAVSRNDVQLLVQEWSEERT